MSEIDDLELELDSLLNQRTGEQLSQLFTYLKIAGSVEGKTKLQIIKLIRIHVEKLISEPGEVDLDVYLRDTISYLNKTPPPLEKSEDEKQIINLSNQLQTLKSKQKEDLDIILNQLEDAKKRVFGDTVLSPPENDQNALPTNSMQTPSILRRDFKISGQIGEPGQADKLTYVSLIHQIESALEKGFTEKEIADGIIKSISPHSSLRNYILTLPDRSLAKLRKFLRVFFQEKTAADLFQELVTTCQGPKESAQQFLLKILDARNKVYFATQEENTQAEYSTTLVQKSFLKSFETGLRDENLVTNLRPLLRQDNISDEVLMQTVNELATKEAARKVKVGFAPERQKAVKVSAAAIDMGKGHKQKEGNQNPTPVVDSKILLDEVKELKSSVASLQQQLENTRQPRKIAPRFQHRGRGRGRGQTQYQRPRGCQTCRSKGIGYSCAHCFKCGGSDHFIAECSSSSAQGNPQRLFPGATE